MPAGKCFPSRLHAFLCHEQERKAGRATRPTRRRAWWSKSGKTFKIDTSAFSTYLAEGRWPGVGSLSKFTSLLGQHGFRQVRKRAKGSTSAAPHLPSITGATKPVLPQGTRPEPAAEGDRERIVREYHHPSFSREHPELLDRVVRAPVRYLPRAISHDPMVQPAMDRTPPIEGGRGQDMTGGAVSSPAKLYSKRTHEIPTEQGTDKEEEEVDVEKVDSVDQNDNFKSEKGHLLRSILDTEIVGSAGDDTAFKHTSPPFCFKAMRSSEGEKRTEQGTKPGAIHPNGHSPPQGSSEGERMLINGGGIATRHSISCDTAGYPSPVGLHMQGHMSGHAYMSPTSRPLHAVIGQAAPTDTTANGPTDARRSSSSGSDRPTDHSAIAASRPRDGFTSSLRRSYHEISGMTNSMGAFPFVTMPSAPGQMLSLPTVPKRMKLRDPAFVGTAAIPGAQDTPRMPLHTPPIINGRSMPMMPAAGFGPRLDYMERVAAATGKSMPGGAFKAVPRGSAQASQIRQRSPQPRAGYPTMGGSPTTNGAQAPPFTGTPIPVRYMSGKMAQNIGLSPPIPALGMVNGQLTPGYFLPLLNPVAQGIMSAQDCQQYSQWPHQHTPGRSFPAENFLNGGSQEHHA